RSRNWRRATTSGGRRFRGSLPMGLLQPPYGQVIIQRGLRRKTKACVWPPGFFPAPIMETRDGDGLATLPPLGRFEYMPLQSACRSGDEWRSAWRSPVKPRPVAHAAQPLENLLPPGGFAERAFQPQGPRGQGAFRRKHLGLYV